MNEARLIDAYNRLSAPGAPEAERANAAKAALDALEADGIGQDAVDAVLAHPEEAEALIERIATSDDEFNRFVSSEAETLRENGLSGPAVQQVVADIQAAKADLTSARRRRSWLPRRTLWSSAGWALRAGSAWTGC
jgi:arsenate reductase-like glutaredoxin family protein